MLFYLLHVTSWICLSSFFFWFPLHLIHLFLMFPAFIIFSRRVVFPFICNVLYLCLFLSFSFFFCCWFLLISFTCLSSFSHLFFFTPSSHLYAASCISLRLFLFCFFFFVFRFPPTLSPVLHLALLFSLYAIFPFICNVLYMFPPLLFYFLIFCFHLSLSLVPLLTLFLPPFM